MKNLEDASADGALRTERRRFHKAVRAGGDSARLALHSSIHALDLCVTFEGFPIAAALIDGCTGDHQLQEGMGRR